MDYTSYPRFESKKTIVAYPPAEGHAMIIIKKQRFLTIIILLITINLYSMHI